MNRFRLARIIVSAYACVAALGTRATAATIVDTVRNRNLVLLDSVVFVLGVVVLGGVCVYWGRRIFLEK